MAHDASEVAHLKAGRSVARLLIGVVILLPLALGTASSDLEGSSPQIQDCPFPADPNLVVGKLLGWVRVELGQSLDHTRTWSDPDGDSVTIELLSAPEGVRLINKPRILSYTLLWRPRRVMTTAIVIRITDKPVRGKPMSDTGTLLVQVVPASKRAAPRLCGGSSR